MRLFKTRHKKSGTRIVARSAFRGSSIAQSLRRATQKAHAVCKASWQITTIAYTHPEAIRVALSCNDF